MLSVKPSAMFGAKHLREATDGVTSIPRGPACRRTGTRVPEDSSVRAVGESGERLLVPRDGVPYTGTPGARQLAPSSHRFERTAARFGTEGSEVQILSPRPKKINRNGLRSTVMVG